MVRGIAADNSFCEPAVSIPRVVTELLSGNPLALAAMAGTAPAGWYEPLPRDARLFALA